jgi:uncharacterized protein YndB with AHSA1/START domain
MADSADTDFIIARTFNAPRQRVWDAWTQPEMLGRWFGPKGSTTTVLRSELRPGGMLHLRLEAPDGGVMWARFVYREVDAPSRLVWVHAFANERGELARSPFGGHWPMELLTTVHFEDAGEATRVTLRWTPISPTAEELRAFTETKPSMQGGWSGSFEQLDLLLAQPG